MTAEAVRNRNSIIDATLEYAKSQLADKELTLVAAFIKQFFSNVPLEDLLKRSTEELYGMVYTHWKTIYQRKPDECKIKVFNPDLKKDGWHSKQTIVEILQIDMPFLVDSMTMELNRLGYSTQLVIHLGGLRAKRNSQGQITELLPFGTKDVDVVAEAPIYLEIDKETDPEKLENITLNLQRILHDVQVVVQDWEPMRARVYDAIADLNKDLLPLDPDEIDEAKAFLHWLVNDHFTFIGYRDYNIAEHNGETILELVSGSGLGVLRDESKSKQTRKLSELPEAAREQALSKQILINSKTNTISTVHRSVHTDYIGVKRFNSDGVIIGERRFIGLYTSDAYHGNPQDIPFLRRKVALILRRSGVLRHGHAAKALMSIMETLPRDDLMQGSVDELTEIAIGIWHLQERRQIRLFARKDAYGRYVSCLVYLPREKFNTQLIDAMQDVLMREFHGVDVNYTPFFPESVLARIHYVIRTDPKKKYIYNVKEIEQQLIEVGQSWNDNLRLKLIERYGEEEAVSLMRVYSQTFPAGYRETFKAASAVHDVAFIEELRAGSDIAMSFYRPQGAEADVLRFKLYRYDEPIPLSDAIPMLENMGLRVLGEQSYELKLEERIVWLNDFIMYYPETDPMDVEEIKDRFQTAFYKIWQGVAGNDTFNRLVLAAKLNWQEVRVLRAYAKHLHQLGFPFSQHYIETAFTNNPQIARDIIQLFALRFDPELSKSREKNIKSTLDNIKEALENVASLDEDRILRRYVDIIQATLRTNYYQTDSEGHHKPYFSYKIDPKLVPELPLPLPKFESFVYSTRFEGVHLRGASVARGGIRWSDRREDFRTEVLGLMKAQQVKNAVIVPYGAKGGFVPKKLPVDGSREAIMQEGIACYQDFIRGLLDLVDNLENGDVVTPANTLRYDGDDPYLVVAADKGTATFSDIANGISAEYHFWLGDAFASGGSAGYDHKKMGITARGAWESVKSHFEEMGVDIQKQDFTAIGIGDMSGDVFGNGMLLSNRMKLVAAFNHMHIFIDPDPDPEISFKERERLFNLPRSMWSDYNEKLISKGGGIYLRSAKAIQLSPEAQKLFGLSKDVIVPAKLVKAILKAEVDLLWNGGIGTYVKSATESDLDVGDRTNDAVRINGDELRAKIVAEGGNLGFTQLGRIEYALHGGRINTDFIDNSGGVDCSDHEVNIKILLGRVMAANKLTLEDRNVLLASMQDEVGQLVLLNNYRQARAIGFAQKQSLEYLELYRGYIDFYEAKGKIPRALEFLPDNATLQLRKASEIGLTRPELAVLQAYSKLILKQEILDVDFSGEPRMAAYIESAFPKPLLEKYHKELSQHRLSRELIATQLSNNLVTNMGITFCYQMQNETSESADRVIRAFVLASEIFAMNDYIAQIESLDNIVSADLQYEMRLDVVRLIRRATRWFLHTRRYYEDISGTIELFQKSLAILAPALPKLLSGKALDSYQARVIKFIDGNVPKSMAESFALCKSMITTLNIMEAAIEQNANVLDVGKVHYKMIDRLDLLWLREQINAYPITDQWAVLARAAFKGDLDYLQRALTGSVISQSASKRDIEKRIEDWFVVQADHVHRWDEMLENIRNSSSDQFSVLTVVMRELVELIRMSSHGGA